MSKTATKTASNTIAQFHALIQARYDFSLVEKRAFYVIINEFGKRLTERIGVEMTPCGDLELRVSTAGMLKANMGLKSVYDALKGLSNKSISIVDGDKTIDSCFIAHYEHLKRKMYIDVVVPTVLLPYITAFGQHFTAKRFAVAVSIKTKYSLRFYEYCLQYERNDGDPDNAYTGYFCLTQEELVHKLMLEEKYPRYSQIKDKVLDFAYREIKELYDAGRCNLYFEYREERGNRRVEKLHFYVYSRKTKAGDKSSIEHLTFINQSLNAWLDADNRPHNKEWISGVIAHVKRQPRLTARLYRGLLKLTSEESDEYRAALARHLIEEKFLD